MKLRIQFILLCLILFSISIDATDSKIENKSVKNIFKRNNITFETRTISGWIRVILSPIKRESYGLILSKKDIARYIKEFKKIKNKKIKGKLK